MCCDYYPCPHYEDIIVDLIMINMVNEGFTNQVALLNSCSEHHLVALVTFAGIGIRSLGLFVPALRFYRVICLSISLQDQVSLG